jgi:hypothetical protein
MFPFKIKHPLEACNFLITLESTLLKNRNSLQGTIGGPYTIRKYYITNDIFD